MQPVQAELSLIVLRALNEDVLNEKELMDDARHAELISGLVPLPLRHRCRGCPADGRSLMQMVFAHATVRTADGDGAKVGAPNCSGAPPDGAAVHWHVGAGSARLLGFFRGSKAVAHRLCIGCRRVGDPGQCRAPGAGATVAGRTKDANRV